MKIEITKSEAEVIIEGMPKDRLEAVIAEHFARIGADGGLTPTVEIVECEHGEGAWPSFPTNLTAAEIKGTPCPSTDTSMLMFDECDRAKVGKRKARMLMNLIRNRNVTHKKVVGLNVVEVSEKVRRVRKAKAAKKK